MAETYRSVIEVLKWVEPKTVLKGAAEVSAHWFKVTVSDELWTLYIEAEGLEELVDTSLQSIKTRYREAISYGHIDCLITGPRNSSLKIFQLSTRSFLRSYHVEAKILYYSSAIAIISNEQFFICGGGSKSRANIISMNNDTVTPLPKMIERRNFHSALYCHNNVYVFGGKFIRASKTAECYRLKERKWWRLPDMLTARYGFNACYRDMKIYLCGGYTCECEVFDIVTYQYSALDFTIPDYRPHFEFIVSFFYKGQLVISTEEAVYFLNDGKCTSVKNPISIDHELITVVRGHFLYTTRFRAPVVYQFDLDTWKTIAQFTPKYWTP